MKFSYKWLNDYVNLSKKKIEDVAEKLTYAGVEVEDIQPLSTATNVVVGKVVEKKAHPDADKLSVCKVDVGEKKSAQIVCGAKNVAEGQYVIVAKVGASLPGGMEINDVEMRGVKSSGMICSLQELGIPKNLIPTEYSEGIYVFNEKDDEVKPGMDAIQALYFDDTMVELSLTPNRSDCLSIEGIAYEVAALYGLPVEEAPLKNFGKNNKNKTFKLNVKTKNCQSFYAAHLGKIKIQSSPRWLQARLIAAGVKPINNVVDVANYAMLITGQPMHAYDFATLGNPDINVNMTKKKSNLTTLDGIENTLLKDKDVVVYNDDKPISIAGIMGSKESEVTDTTEEILLEVATFSSTNIRKTAKRLGYKTEASKRFEKKICPLLAQKGFKTALFLFKEICGAKIIHTDTYVSNKKLVALKTKKISLKKINDVLGMNLSEDDVRATLNRLNFNFASFAGKFVIYIPFRRQDINITEDIIEEVGRIHGYDSINTTLPSSNLVGSLNEKQKLKRSIKNVLEANGLNEAINYSLTTETKNIKVVPCMENTTINLLHPMSEERTIYRTQLLEGLLNSSKYNQARNNEVISFYELSNLYSTLNKNTVESTDLSGVISESKKIQGEDVFYALKNILCEVLKHCNVENKIDFVPFSKNESFHPGRTAKIIYNETAEEIGIIGEIHPNIADEYDLKRTAAFQLNFDKLFEYKDDSFTFVPVSKYPEVLRDVAVEFDNKVLVGNVIKTIKNLNNPLIQDVKVIDIYTGDKIEAGKKSVTFSLKLSSAEQTLETSEINTLVDLVVKNICDEHNGRQRA